MEETKELSLEDLSYVLNMPKRKFIRYQVAYVKWFVWRYFMGNRSTMAPEMDNDGVSQQMNDGSMQMPGAGGRSFRTHSERGSRISSIRSVSPRHTGDHIH